MRRRLALERLWNFRNVLGYTVHPGEPSTTAREEVIPLYAGCRDLERERHRKTEKERHRERDRERDTERETERERERE